MMLIKLLIFKILAKYVTQKTPKMLFSVLLP